MCHDLRELIEGVAVDIGRTQCIVRVYLTTKSVCIPDHLQALRTEAEVFEHELDKIDRTR